MDNQLRTVKLMIKCAQARRKAGEATLRLVLDKLELLEDLIITNHELYLYIFIIYIYMCNL